MSYQIDYGRLIAQKGEESAQRTACVDAIRYVGQPLARAFFRGVMWTDEHDKIMKMFTLMSGVSGYPARALFERALARRKRMFERQRLPVS